MPGALNGRRWKIVLAMALAAAVAVLFTAVPRPARVHAWRWPAPAVFRSGFPYETLLSPSPWVRLITEGYPDGKGQALFWATRSDSPHTWHLLRLPEGKILATASGFEQVFWVSGGVAAGEISVMRRAYPFFGLLYRIPVLNRVGFIAGHRNGHRELEFYAIDTDRLTIAPLPAAMKPAVRYYKGSFVFKDPSLAETRKRGDMEVSCERWTDGTTGKVTQFVKLANHKDKTVRTLFESTDASEVSDPFFADDDMVMFERDNGVWQVKVSTGKAQELLPPQPAVLQHEPIQLLRPVRVSAGKAGQVLPALVESTAARETQLR